MFNYVKESYNELVNKVAWPSFPQLQSSTVVVMVASAIFAIVASASGGEGLEFPSQLLRKSIDFFYNLCDNILVK